MIDDPRMADHRTARRDAIRQEWDASQARGWKAKYKFDESDPKWHFWMNGLDGAAKHQQHLGFEMKDVPGWK